jgi:TetR/AcrR family transcriptional regulator, regulator of autoinduction and epiphytic fitness
MAIERPAPPPLDDEPERIDGRRARRASNRQAAVDALIALYREGRYTPTAVEIAERAGLSVRSLFRYFDDVDDLAGAAIDHQASLAYPLLTVDAAPHDPLEVRITQLVESRVHQFEILAPAAIAARVVAHRRPAVAAELAEVSGARRDQIRSLFSAELSAMGPHDARRTLAAVDVMCSFEAYRLLRHEHDLEPDDLVVHLAEAVALLLGGGTGP